VQPGAPPQGQQEDEEARKKRGMIGYRMPPFNLHRT
jgi:hypothetical protein